MQRTDQALMMASHREQIVLEALRLLHEAGSIPWDVLKIEHEVSRGSIQRWISRYQAEGLPGLMDKCTLSGRRTEADKLQEELGQVAFDAIIKKVQALNYDYKSNAMAWHKVALAPDAPLPLKSLFEKIMRCHSSKHTIPRSLRELTTVNPAQRLLHRGKKAFKLKGSYISRKLDILPGDIYVSDDETDNVYCAVKTPVSEKYPHGYKVMQVQCFPMLDFASQYVGSFAMVARERGSYRATDLWAFFGHAIRDMKLPRLGFQFERGTWESNIIRGVKVEYSSDEPSSRQRIGGLEMLPNNVLPWHREHAGMDVAMLGKTLRIHTSFTPKSKPVEGWFNRSQKLRQSFWGYAGRDQRKTPQEKILKIAGACMRGTENPAEHFMLMEELYQVYGKSIYDLNNIPMEGEVFKGTPQAIWEEWTTKAGYEQLTMHPATSWMYKSMWAQGYVHGPFIRVRMTDELTRQRYTEVWASPMDLHAYDHKNVIVYWDRDNLESPAVIVDRRSGEYLCEAQHVDKPGTFLDDDMSALRIVRQWESFNCTMYGDIKRFIPSLQKPEGVRKRQADARREERRQVLDPTASQALTTVISADDHTDPISPAPLPKIISREAMLAS